MRPSSRSAARLPARMGASLLILALMQCPAVLLGEGAGAHAAHKKPVRAARRLTKNERALQALNRLTFGPQPGDVERVEAMGVRKWIDLQLSPEKIDDSLLQARLRNYPAMEMPLRSLIEEFPAYGIVRNVADGRFPMPQDRVERAIYDNQIYDYEQRKQKQAEEAAGAHRRNPSAPAANPPQAQRGNGVAVAMTAEDVVKPSSMQAHEQRLYADLASTAIINQPADRRWNTLVNMEPDRFQSFMRSLTPDGRLQLTEGMSPQQKQTVFALINPTLMIDNELLQTRLLTDIYSKRQLQAVMIDFWLNHFNIYLRKGQLVPWYLVDFERNAIAPNAMGKFENLLVATAKSPAMLFYLDNQTSVGPDSPQAVRAKMNPRYRKVSLGINENYGRELMELHTLGVNGGYTQKDVIEVAKVFTGWTIDDPRRGGGFIFNERRHEPGPKYVLGTTIQEDGEQEGLEVLHLLASSPATAHHLSYQLAQRFVSDNPPPALVNRMAKTYLKTGGDIRQVLRTMFTSPEFWSRAAYRAKVKTPEEFVISAVRATGGDVVRPALLLNAMNELGMPFYGFQTPNGYSWTANTWVNTGDLLDRMNISLAIAGNRLGTTADLDSLLKIDNPGAATTAEKEQRMESVLLGAPLAPEIRDTVLQQIGDGLTPAVAQSFRPSPGKRGKSAPGLPKRAASMQMIDFPAPVAGPADKQAAMLAGLLLGSPDFQKK